MLKIPIPGSGTIVVLKNVHFLFFFEGGGIYKLFERQLSYLISYIVKKMIWLEYIETVFYNAQTRLKFR